MFPVPMAFSYRWPMSLFNTTEEIFDASTKGCPNGYALFLVAASVPSLRWKDGSFSRLMIHYADTCTRMFIYSKRVHCPSIYTQFYTFLAFSACPSGTRLLRRHIACRFCGGIDILAHMIIHLHVYLHRRRSSRSFRRVCVAVVRFKKKRKTQSKQQGYI